MTDNMFGSEKEYRTKMGAIKAFVKSRNESFTAFAVNDDWDACLKHFWKYGIDIPKNEIVAKSGVLKAIQVIENIPQDVKAKAAEKCVALGFKPNIRQQG